MNGESRGKRKHSPGPVSLRSAKHLKPGTPPPLTHGDETPLYDLVDDAGDSRMLPLGPTQADSPEWQATIEEVVKSVVSIHFCQTASFDTDLSMSSQATGFVVDSQRGYILTNRHVVCAGPFWGYCIFDNHEEARVKLIPNCCLHICKLACGTDLYLVS
jgi:S1-C subfamily serine protease